MKTNKIILTLSLLFLTVFGLAACDSHSDIFSEVLAATNQIDSVSVAYQSNDVEKTVSEMSSSETIYAVQTLSETEEVPEVNQFILFNQLRSGLIETHETIVDSVEAFREVESTIRNNIQILREKGYDILEGDKELIRGYIVTLKSYYNDLMATKGTGYKVLYELEYTRENLTVVNETFVEVQEVFDYRLEVVENGILVLEEINSLILDYME